MNGALNTVSETVVILGKGLYLLTVTLEVFSFWRIWHAFPATTVRNGGSADSVS